LKIFCVNAGNTLKVVLCKCMNWFLYIVECSDASLYTGITTNLKRRVDQHNSKKGAKSLKGKIPVKLVYNESFKDQVEAARREREIKSWRRKYKLLLIEEKKVYPDKGFTRKLV